MLKKFSNNKHYILLNKINKENFFAFIKNKQKNRIYKITNYGKKLIENKNSL